MDFLNTLKELLRAIIIEFLYELWAVVWFFLRPLIWLYFVWGGLNIARLIFSIIGPFETG